MADIFLSYAREDAGRARELVNLLESRGWEVWWDERLRFGGRFEDEIGSALDEARCVVVLWSRHSVGSDWVKSEAAEALERDVLVPVRLDDAELPFAFRWIHTADLSHWDGSSGDDVVGRLLDDIAGLLAGPDGEPVPEPVTEEEPVSEERCLDAALPETVTVGSSTELIAMVRLADSGGLRGLLEIREEFEARPKDVRSAGFELEFPLDERSRPISLDFWIELETDDFDVARPRKLLRVRPGRDTQPAIFIITPRRTGTLRIVVGLYLTKESRLLVSGLLRSNGRSDGVVSRVASFISVALGSIGVASRRAERETAAAAAGPSADRPGGVHADVGDDAVDTREDAVDVGEDLRARSTDVPRPSAECEDRWNSWGDADWRGQTSTRESWGGARWLGGLWAPTVVGATVLVAGLGLGLWFLSTGDGGPGPPILFRGTTPRDLPPVNRPPTLECRAERSTVRQGESVRLFAASDDPDGDALTYTWRAAAGRLSSTTGPEVTWSSVGVPPGSGPITVTVTDHFGGTATCVLRVTVVAGSTPPAEGEVEDTDQRLPARQ